MSFTHDEALTFITFVGIDKIFTPIFYAHSNNHLLNSALMTLSTFVSSEEIFMRIFNLTAFLIFSYFLYLYLNNKEIIIFPLFPLFMTLPLVLEFFSLARGYGLGLAFTMSGYLFYYKFLQQMDSKNQKLFYISAFLSILSNYIYIFAFIPIILIDIASSILKLFRAYSHKNSNISTIVKMFFYENKYFVFFCVLSTLTWIPIFIINLFRRQFYYGGSSGFVEDTLFNFASWNFRYPEIFVYSFIIFLLFSVFIQTFLLVKRQKLLLFNFSLVFSVLIQVILFTFFHIKLPIGRASIWLFLLFFLAIAEMLHFILNKTNLKNLNFLIYPIILYFTLFTVTFTYNHLESNKTREWDFNACDKEIVNLLPVNSVVLVDWLNYPVFEYYNQVNNKNLQMLSFRQHEGVINNFNNRSYKDIIYLDDINWDYAYIKDNYKDLLRNFDEYKKEMYCEYFLVKK